MMKYKKIKILFMILSVLLISGCANQEPIAESFHSMGTLVDITVYGENAQNAITKAEEILNDIENKMSLNISDSEVNEINSQAGLAPVQVSEETFEVIKRAIYYGELTDGQFDISIAPITSLWNIGQDNERIPKDKEIEEALQLVNHKNIQLNEKDRSVFLEKNGMKIDLGGIAKGYAGDKIIQTFREMSIENALINLGGDMKVIGENPQKNRPWNVGIRHPREARGAYFATTQLEDGQAIVSSGDYERFFIEDGVRYHHIFNGHTGKPSRTDVIGTTVIADSTMDADALATSIFLLESQEALEFIENIEGVQAVIVTEQLDTIITEGLENNLEMQDM